MSCLVARNSNRSDNFQKQSGDVQRYLAPPEASSHCQDNLTITKNYLTMSEAS